MITQTQPISSKLTMSLVKELLKFLTYYTQKCYHFLHKKVAAFAQALDNFSA